MPKVEISSNMPHEPHTPQNEMSPRKAAPKKSSLSFEILAKSWGGKYVLVLENRTYKVLLARECGKKVRKNALPFNHKGHKRDLERIGYNRILQGVVIPYGSKHLDLELFVYHLEGNGTQWLPKKLFSDCLAHIQNFKELCQTSQGWIDDNEIAAGNSMDRSDAVAAVSGTDRSEHESNGYEFKKLFKSYANKIQQLIHLATENPAKVQRDIMEMLKSDAKLTLGAVYPDMGLLQEILCRATKSDDAVGEILSNMPFSMLLAYLKSVNPEDRAKAVDTWSTDNTKNMQWLLRVIVSLENSMEELVKTNNQEDGVITIGFRPPSNDHVETC
jgi:hypothetical protein